VVRPLALAETGDFPPRSSPLLWLMSLLPLYALPPLPASIGLAHELAVCSPPPRLDAAQSPTLPADYMSKAKS
jgi:hypothetical protein